MVRNFVSNDAAIVSLCWYATDTVRGYGTGGNLPLELLERLCRIVYNECGRSSSMDRWIGEWKRNGQLAIVKARYFRKAGSLGLCRGPAQVYRFFQPFHRRSVHPFKSPPAYDTDYPAYKIIRVYTVYRESRKLIISRYTCAGTCSSDSFTASGALLSRV